MNGATAEPCVNTTRPSTTAITSRMGNIQNFLRARRKRQSSPAKETMFTLQGCVRSSVALKTDCAAVARRSGRVTFYPVGRRVAIKVEAHEILAAQPHDEAGRHNNGKKEEPHHNRRNAGQAQREFEPAVVKRLQNGRMPPCDHRKDAGKTEGGPAGILATQQWPG